jgi:glycosyltransferase involved in cell wall biosynthesis
MVLVLACCHNVAKYLPRFRQNLEQVASRVIIFENDSTDGTQDFLQDWAKGNPDTVTVITQTGIFDRFPHRTTRLAFCRNQLLAQTRGVPEEHTLVIDADDVSQDFDAATFATNFEVEAPWDALAVNTGYDVWALRSDECPGDCWKQVRQVSPSFRE